MAGRVHGADKGSVEDQHGRQRQGEGRPADGCRKSGGSAEEDRQVVSRVGQEIESGEQREAEAVEGVDVQAEPIR